MSSAVDAWLKAAGTQPLLTAQEELLLAQRVRAWLDHPDGRDAAPAAIQRRGRRAMNRMVSGNLRLVVAVARRYRPRIHNAALSLEDLLQEGALGLHRAVEKFDPKRGYKFSTYAYWWVSQSCGRAIDTLNATIRPSASALSIWRQWIYRQPATMTLEEFAAARGQSLRTVRQMVFDAARAERISSLDVALSGDGGEMSALVELVAAPSTAALEDMDRQLAIEQLESLRPADLGLVEQRLVMKLPAAEVAAAEGVRVRDLKGHVEQARKRLALIGGSEMRELVA